MRRHKIAYWDALADPKGLLNLDVSKSIETVLRGRFEKLNTSSSVGKVYSARINREKRLLFTDIIVNEQRLLLILSVLENHEYDSALFLQDGALRDYFAKLNLKKEDIIPFDDNNNNNDHPHESAEMDLIEFVKLGFHKNKFYQLSESQLAVLEGSYPLVVSGYAGSGKTLIGLELLKKEMANAVQSEAKRFVYVTKSLKLAQDMKAEWSKLPSQSVGAHSIAVDFMTYEALCLIKNDNYDFMVVDEAQDLDEDELRKLEDYVVKKQAITHKKEMPQICYLLDVNQNLKDGKSRTPFLLQRHTGYVQHVILNKTFRCPPAVIKLANAVKSMQSLLTGGLADKYQKLLIEESAEQEVNLQAQQQPPQDESVKWVASFAHLDNQEALIKMLQTSGDIIVITTAEFLEEARAIFGKSVVFTAEQIKGMEFKTIICYRVLDSYAKENKELSKINIEEAKVSGHRAKSGRERPEFVVPFNKLYVTLTRATEQIVLLQESHHNNEHIYRFLEKSGIQKQNNVNIKLEGINVFTKERWLQKINEAIMQHNVDYAKQLYLEHIVASENDFEEYRKKILGQDTPIVRDSLKKTKRKKQINSQASSDVVGANANSDNESNINVLSVYQEAQISLSEINNRKHFIDNDGLLKEPEFFKNLLVKAFINKYQGHSFFNEKQEKLKQILKAAFFAPYLKGVLDEINQYIEEVGSNSVYYNIEEVSLSRDVFIGVFYHLPVTSITCLSMGVCNIRDSYLPALEKLLPSCIHLKELQLWENLISDKGMAVIAEILKKNSHLQDLNLETNDNTNAGVIKLLDALHSNTNLTHLKFTSSQTSSPEKIVEALCKLLIKNKTLKQLNVGDFFEGVNPLVLLPLLIALKKSNCGICNLDEDDLLSTINLFSLLIDDADDSEVLKFIDLGANIHAVDPRTGANVLFCAVQLKRKVIVERLIKEGADPNCPDNNGACAMHVAVEDLSLVKLLFPRVININERDKKGMTPLHYAAQRNENLEVVKFFLENNAEINIQSRDGFSPLYLAVNFGCVDIIKLLLLNGADILTKDNKEYSLLFIAVDKDHLPRQIESIKLLLKKADEKGVKQELLESKNNEGDTVLWFAVLRKQNSVLTKLLLDAKEDPYSKYLLKKYYEKLFDVFAFSMAMHHAIVEADSKLTLQLLARSDNPLSEAISRGDEGKPTVKYILDFEDEKGDPLLFAAIKANMMGLVGKLKQLAASCIDMTFKNKDGKTAFDLAEGNPLMMQLLTKLWPKQEVPKLSGNSSTIFAPTAAEGGSDKKEPSSDNGPSKTQ